MDELKAKVAQIENSKPALEALLKRVLELESKLSEGKEYGAILTKKKLTLEQNWMMQL